MLAQGWPRQDTRDSPEQRDSNTSSTLKEPVRAYELHPESSSYKKIRGVLTGLWFLRHQVDSMELWTLSFNCKGVLTGAHSRRGLGPFTVQKLYIKTMFFRAHFEAHTYKAML